MNHFTIQNKADGLHFKIRVQPRSSKNQVAGEYGDALKINLTAPPVENAANKACCAFLASLLAVPKSRIVIVSGHTGRNKQVAVHCQKGSGQRESIQEMIMSWVKK